MKILKFKCTTLSDVILNAKAATSGPNETLDFIPGSNFLGIAASQLYPQLSPEEALTIFHSGKVRFGDAHPSLGKFRGLKVPAAMFYPKLSSPARELYIHHLIPADKDMSAKQLKQCRNGFYDFSSSGIDGKNSAALITTSTNFAIKSAYDRNARRSKDEQLFGYQSLQKGLVMYFSIEIGDEGDSEQEIEALAEKISKAITGTKRIGRSRSAQYGLVNIESADFGEQESGKPTGNIVTVYADSRLIFLDEFGMPTFSPTAKQLNLNGEILWDKSQIRTFRYAPWNFKRQSFDTDRCGIEKGSVMAVRIDEGSSADDIKFRSSYVGAYNNEGFGRIIYNPAFLKADAEGRAVITLKKSLEDSNESQWFGRSKAVPSSPLLDYLRNKKADNTDIYGKVNKWVKDNLSLFKGDKFSSQWGTIRSMAAASDSLEQLKKDLFAVPTGYLSHGVAKEKWRERGRFAGFKKFVDNLNSSDYKKAIVNLAAEMAKKSN